MFVNGKEVIGMFCFPVMSEHVTFTEQQLLKRFETESRVVHTDEHENVH